MYCLLWWSSLDVGVVALGDVYSSFRRVYLQQTVPSMRDTFKTMYLPGECTSTEFTFHRVYLHEVFLPGELLPSRKCTFQGVYHPESVPSGWEGHCTLHGTYTLYPPLEGNWDHTYPLLEKIQTRHTNPPCKQTHASGKITLPQLFWEVVFTSISHSVAFKKQYSSDFCKIFVKSPATFLFKSITAICKCVVKKLSCGLKLS